MTTAMVGDRELAQFRQQYYALLVTLLSREPTAELLATLAGGIAERAEAARELHPALGQAWDTLRQMLPEVTVESANDEFLKLFIGPFQPEINFYESWYLMGQMFQQPLIVVRKFLGDVGLERAEDAFHEPEDSLPFELEVMNWLVSRQLAAQSPEEENDWLHRQAAFLKQHLLIWGPACADEIAAAKSAVLYRGAAQLVRGLLALERQLFERRGVTDVETLEQARRRYGARRAFQGPVYDPSAPPKAGGDLPPGEQP